MKTARLLAVTAAVAGLASFPLMAQEVNASAQQSTSASAAGMYANSVNAGANAGVNQGQANANGEATGSLGARGRHGSANADAYGRAAGNAQMRPVTGVLEGKLDSKSAKAGEPVVLKTTKKMKTADGFVIPRGSRLIGHVTEVQAHTRGHDQSSMGIAFDRAQLKNGQSFTIHSVIESVGPTAAELEADSMADEDAFAGPVGGGAMGSGAVAGRARGGLLSSGAGMVGGATSDIGSVGSRVASNTGGAIHASDNAIGATGGVTGNAAANAGRGVTGSAGTAGSLGAHATAIPGIMLDSNAAEGASGTFTAARRNVHFDSGTQMVVDVVAAK